MTSANTHPRCAGGDQASGHHHHACAEYNRTISRRSFLTWSGSAAAAAATAPAWLPRVVFARDAGPARDVLVSVYLRGGADGLTLCAPHFDPFYYVHRPSLALPRPGQTNGVTDLDGRFGFSPHMAPLMESWNNGHLAVIHACGLNDPTRSHFEAQRFMESALLGATFAASGWLGRHLQTSPPVLTDSLMRGVGLNHGLALTLAGGPKTIAVPDVNGFGLGGNWDTALERLGALVRTHTDFGEPMKTPAVSTQATINALEAVQFNNYQPENGAVYPNSDFGRALKSTAALIKAQIGVEAVAVDRGGWDTHSNQGNVDGDMAQNMADLAGALGAFQRDVFARFPRVTVVVMSEFGRNAIENNSFGTDHGHGNVMLAMGPGIAGGRVLGQWPGLGNLYEDQDLAITTDYRDVLGEIIARRLNNANLAAVFPGYAPVFRGVTR